MIRIHIFCEGQTEDVFVREVLQDHFLRLNISVNPILIRTSKSGKGGVSSFAKIKRQLERKCKEDRDAWVTTMLDFYGLPMDFPDISIVKAEQDIYRKATLLEQSFSAVIDKPNFIANIIFHEFEGLLYSDTTAFDSWFGDKKSFQLNMERASFETPEHINDDSQSAPSKRLLKHFPDYEKTWHGPSIALDIGLDVIRKECRHFNEWLKRLEKLKV